ncbi:MAG: tryptophan-rich sensory protein [Legionellaceae bacterium]|nr:tryptophan-rich sensory protein [Legionellaceae bacterium]
MGVLTQENLTPWYATLTKSALTPPDHVFAIVWPILYLLLAVVGLNLFLQKNQCTTKEKYTYSIQLILNWLWSPIFFHFHAIGTALIILAIMVLLTTTLVYMLYARHRMLALLLMPYLAWILFATYLNTIVWMAI